MQGHEPIEFIRLFPSWQTDATESIKPVSTIFKRFDALTLSQRPKMAADTQLIDDGIGERKIYHVTKDKIIEKSQSKAVIFITDQCYMIEYTVMVSMSPDWLTRNHETNLNFLSYQQQIPPMHRMWASARSSINGMDPKPMLMT